MKKTTILIALSLLSFGYYAQEKQSNSLGQKTIHQTSPTPQSLQNDDNASQAIWEQDRSYAENEFSITSSHYDLADWGMYAADDFELAGETEIEGIFFHGSQSDEDGGAYINGINLYFYEDADGIPSGNPAEESSAILKVTDIPYDSEFVEVEPGEDSFLGYKEYFIDLQAYLGETLSLEAGHYWVSIVFNLNLEEADFDIRWLWTDSSTENLNKPMVIDPTDALEAGITEWTLIEEVGFPMTDLAFTLYGETEELSVPSQEAEAVKVYPNPTTDVVHFNLPATLEVESIKAVDFSGKTHSLNWTAGQVSLEHLATGTYILNVQTNKGAILKKIIKN